MRRFTIHWDEDHEGESCDDCRRRLAHYDDAVVTHGMVDFKDDDLLDSLTVILGRRLFGNCYDEDTMLCASCLEQRKQRKAGAA